jgi:hypothetical protein
MEILDKEKVTAIKRQQHVETAAQLHLERVVKLKHNLQEEKARNENLNRLLGWAHETFTKLEQKSQEVALLQV